MKKYLDLMTQNGYVPADQIKDFGEELRGVYYFLRKRVTSWEYVSLMSHSCPQCGDLGFCGASYELFMAEKNTRRAKGTPKASELAKKGYNVLVASLPRTMEDLMAVATKTDEQVGEEVTLLYNLLLVGENKK